MELSDIDSVDQDIIRMLLDNGRMSYSKIGELLNLSRVAIQKRVEALVQSGVIEIFTIRVNATKLGQSVPVFFEVEVEPRYAEAVGNTLAEDPNVVSIYQMTGPSTLHMHALLKDDKDMEHFLYKKIYALEGVVRVETHLTIRRFKQGTGLEL